MQQSCTNCSASFEITDEDLAFYEKVSPTFSGKKYLIPPPTHCPGCRQQRRMLTRNELILYRRRCDLTGENIVSMYDANVPFPIYSQASWFGDGWDGCTYGIPWSNSKPFFEQWHSLFLKTPKIALYSGKSENCTYANNSESNKNCYLCMAIMWSEDCYYSRRIMNSTWIVDCYDVFRSQNCYESITVESSHNIAYCYGIKDSFDLLFCHDCASCRNCIGCTNLRQKEYCILNKQVSKEEYENKYKELSASHCALDSFASQYRQFLSRQIARALHNTNVENCTGDYLSNCKQCHQCFLLKEAEDCRYCSIGSKLKDVGDDEFNDKSELCYETTGIEQAHSTIGSYISIYTHNCTYSHLLVSCRDCFGCSSLKHKQYCLFNQQYTEEEYKDLIPKVITHMQSTQEWGEFFPPTMSPFAYNETVAQENYPLTKEEVLAKGWKWRDPVDDLPKVEKEIPAEKLPDSIDDIPDDVLNWAIECKTTKRPFKIIGQELAFYRQMKLPVPHFHPDERHRKRMALRNPRKLHNRKCAKCKKDIQTTYSSERPETVYCEECYLKEVY